MDKASCSNVYLPQVRRQGKTIKVDTWGGEGSLSEGLTMTDIKHVTGTLTLTYHNEEDAISAEETLVEWCDNDELVAVEASSSGRIILQNQRTGQRVIVNP